MIMIIIIIMIIIMIIIIIIMIIIIIIIIIILASMNNKKPFQPLPKKHDLGKPIFKTRYIYNVIISIQDYVLLYKHQCFIRILPLRKSIYYRIFTCENIIH